MQRWPDVRRGSLGEFVHMDKARRVSQQATPAADGPEAGSYAGLAEGAIVSLFLAQNLCVVGASGGQGESCTFEEEDGAAGGPGGGQQVEFHIVPMRQGCGRPRAAAGPAAFLSPLLAHPPPANTPQPPTPTLASSPGEATWHSHCEPVPAEASSLSDLFLII